MVLFWIYVWGEGVAWLCTMNIDRAMKTGDKQMQKREKHQNPSSFPNRNLTETRPSLYDNAITFLISAIAFPGFNPFGQVREQLRMVWHRYKLIELSSIAFRSSFRSSRLSASQRNDCSSTAGPRYSSLFHQYEGQEVEQHAHRIHS